MENSGRGLAVALSPSRGRRALPGERRLSRLLQFANAPTKRLHLLPVGEFDHRIRVGGALGHPHDEADHGAVERAVTRVVDLAREHRQPLRFPGDAARGT